MAEYLYDMRKKNHLCVICGEKDAYTMVGRACCAECVAKYAERYKENYRKNSDRYLENAKKRHKRLMDAGMCVRCGKVPADNGYTTCGICRKKHNTAQNARNAKKREAMYGDIDIPENERCTRCHKRPRHEDHKLCRECYESTVAANRRIAKENAANHPWREYWKGRKREG